jgi:hypothetical protein
LIILLYPLSSTGTDFSWNPVTAGRLYMWFSHPRFFLSGQNR